MLASQRAAAQSAPSAGQQTPVVERVGSARLRVVGDEAEAALATIDAPDSEAAHRAWQRVLASEGYWALHARL
jgi:hypothetical protein